MAKNKTRFEYVSFGSDSEGIVVSGDPKKPEPAHARIDFPGGNVTVVRATDGEDSDYWVHVSVNHPKGHSIIKDETTMALVVGIRIDHAQQPSEELKIPIHAEHFAVRVRAVSLLESKKNELPFNYTEDDLKAALAAARPKR